MSNDNGNDGSGGWKKILYKILEELLRSVISVSVPLAASYLINRNRKESSPDKETVHDVKFDFSTNHDWEKRQSPKMD